MLGNIIAGFIVIIVGTSLLPTVANQIALSRMNGTGIVDGIGSNVTGASVPITGLITLFFALGVASMAIGIAAQGLKQAGFI